uniref:Uncharacterized protein n=1 Tax=viral metagenome TaxID=1070528 RepID=A0A6M3LHY9_9ZZZZ
MSGPTDPAEAHFDKGLWGYDGSEWRKLQLLWGYYDRWQEYLGETKSGDGHFTVSCAAVPAGYVYVLQMATLVNDTGARGAVRIWARTGSSLFFLVGKVTPAQYEPLVWTGALALKAGDYVQLQQLSCQDGDMIYCGVWGYKMRIAM